MSLKQNDNYNEQLIEMAEECGLVHTGEYEDGLPQFIGNNVAWDKFNKGI